MKTLPLKRIAMIVLITAFSVSAQAVSAATGTIKIGVVDMSKLLSQSPQAQAAQDDMNKKFATRKNELISEQDKIKNLQDQLNKNGAVMSSAQLQDLQNQLNDLQRDFSRKQSDYMDDVNMQRNEELSKLQQAIAKAAQELGQSQKFNIILAEGLLYSDDTVDVTDQVLAQMQKDYKADSSKGGN